MNIQINNNNPNNNNDNIQPIINNNQVANEEVMRELPPAQSIQNADDDYYNAWIKEFSLIIFFSHIFAILLIFTFLNVINYIFAFIPLFLWDLYDIYLIIKRIKSLSLRYLFYSNPHFPLY